MTRKTQKSTSFLPWREHCCCSIVILAALIPMWLSPPGAYAKDVILAAPVHVATQADRDRRQVASPLEVFDLLDRHYAFESEENRESEVERDIPAFCSLPLMPLQIQAVISRIGAISEHARISVLHSLALPMLC